MGGAPKTATAKAAFDEQLLSKRLADKKSGEVIMGASKGNVASFLTSLAFVIGAGLWCVGYPAYRDYSWASSTISDKERSGWRVASKSSNFIDPGHFWTLVRTPVTQIGFIRPDDIAVWGKFPVTRVLWANYNYEKSEEHIALEIFDCERKQLATAPENLAADSQEARNQKLEKLEWQSFTDEQPGAQNLKFVCDEIAKNPRHSEIEYTEEETAKLGEFLKEIDRNPWNADRKNDLRAFLASLTSRNGRKLTRLEADGLSRAFQTTLDFRDEAVRILFETWDSGQKPSMGRLEVLQRSMLEVLGGDRKSEVDDVKVMIEAAERKATSVVLSDGIKREFSRTRIEDIGFSNQIFRQNADAFRSILKEFTEE